VWHEQRLVRFPIDSGNATSRLLNKFSSVRAVSSPNQSGSSVSWLKGSQPAPKHTNAAAVTDSSSSSPERTSWAEARA
jgi:hypothetical protein